MKEKDGLAGLGGAERKGRCFGRWMWLLEERCSCDAHHPQLGLPQKTKRISSGSH